jgi:ABC-type molybdate transport system substrate-binding protein
VVPQKAHPRIEQAAVVLKGAQEPGLAEAFVRFLTGEAGRAILARHGFESP